MNSNKICYVIGAGELFRHSFFPAKGDLVIAADGGYQYVKKMGLHADMVVGDFDSLGQKPDHPNVIVLQKEKDDTDMAVSLKQGLQKGYRVFHIYGGMGGRIDHTLANIQCLAYLSEHGARGFLFGKDIVITAITNSTIDFDEGCDGIISMFSHSDISTGVTNTGLKYPLVNATIYNDFPLGVSNEFSGGRSSITVEKGTLIITYSIATMRNVIRKL